MSASLTARIAGPNITLVDAGMLTTFLYDGYAASQEDPTSSLLVVIISDNQDLTYEAP